MSRVESYAASNLRYVGEAKLARLSDADLLELHRLLVHKLGAVPEALPALPEDDKVGVIKAILELKVKIGTLTKAEADATAATLAPETPVPTAAPAPHEEHDAQQGKGMVEGAVRSVVRDAMEGVAQSVVRAAEKRAAAAEEEEEQGEEGGGGGGGGRRAEQGGGRV